MRVAATSAFVVLVLLRTFAAAQAPLTHIAGWPPVAIPPTAATNAPQVHDDHTITFRLAAPNAQRVALELRAGGPPPQGHDRSHPMMRDSQGLWSVTIGPEPPEIYRYAFLVDGISMPDPHNQSAVVGRAQLTSYVEVPGSPPRFDQWRDVPHGALHLREYRSAVLGIQRTLYVWVPPQYEVESRRRFPVVYLRHGNGDPASTWATLGHAGIIAENLIADGRATPMILVMPSGYPSDSGEGSTEEGVVATTRELLEDIVPFVDGHYRVVGDAAHRAIAGLSMGGMQAFISGLRNVDKFAWIGAFSSTVVILDPRFNLRAAIPGLDDAAATNKRVRLLFLSCGTEDPRFDGHLTLMSVLKANGIRHEWFSTPGSHEWKVWRQSLAEFLSMLFKAAR